MAHQWKISIVGAFDRFNYGDVLFGKVAEANFAKALPDAAQSFFALRTADLTAEGGTTTKPLRAIYDIRPDEGQKHIVMLSGGEVLSPTWTQMAEHHVPRQVSVYLKKLHYRTGHAAWDPLWRRIYGCPNLTPWVIDPHQLQKPDQSYVVYNAVGGTTTKTLSAGQMTWQKDALSRATWLTVRDQVTSDALAARGLPAPEVVPDSAVTMAKLLTPDAAQRYRRDILAHAGLRDQPYVCMQTGAGWAKGNYDEIAQHLREIHARTGLQILSFAIGRAAGHDDQIASARINDILGHETWFGEAPHTLPVNGIMALIAGSACYVGTSLHGFITAFSFGRPRVGLMPQLLKVTGFRDSWDLPTMPAGIAYAAMADAVDAALAHEQDILTARAADVAQIYHDSFDAMIARLEVS